MFRSQRTDERANTQRPQLLGIGGVVGPAAFIGAWIAAGALTERSYSPVDDAISRLAARGVDTQPLMTTGFIAFGVSLPLFAIALRRRVPGAAWTTAAATGIATLAVAATPLDTSELVDRLHGLAAGFGYVTLAATPLLAARQLLQMGHRALAFSGVAAGLVSASALAVTTTSLPNGLFQRIGLTTSDVWIVAAAYALLRRGPLDGPSG